MDISLIVIIAIVAILGIFLWSTYNGLVTLNVRVDEAWSDITVQLKRRADLIPNLVNTVKGAANFEQETLTRLVEARAKATSVNISADNLTPEKMAEFQQAQAGVSQGIGRLLAVVENYPDIKANQNFRDLQAQLEGTENRIKVSRNDFNAAVQQYNGTVRTFPNNLFAGMFGFKTKEGFAADPGSDKAPEVKF